MTIRSQLLHITTESILAYAQSIESPEQYIHDQLVAPVTMPILFWRLFEPVHSLNTDEPLVHGYQHFAYQKPITAGMILQCELSLLDVQQKIRPKHELTLFYYRLTGYEEEKLIFIADTTLIKIGDHNAKADYS